jgi:uncharacterized protein
MAIPFLTAWWSNLFLATYAVPPEVLERRLPRGLALDMRDGHAFVSLVAFDFLNTRVLRVPWPGYRNFPEINLRFYVRWGAERGVVFVREFVPSRMVAALARLLYNEPYAAVPMRSTVREMPAEIDVEHRLVTDGREHTIRVRGSKPPTRPNETSIEHFFKEHRWGYGVTRGGQTVRYEVVHAQWDVYAVQQFSVDLDWSAVYGPEWGFLADAQPYSTVLAAGSPIAVYRGHHLGNDG